ncbi:MAG: hypothetical protein HY585_02345 [Candidatus Omnitrophica bacterium]|nr:hypothetical protein [Candidatus Omnitrophota bacterium]
MINLDYAIFISVAGGFLFFILVHVLLMRTFKAIGAPLAMLSSIVACAFLNGFIFFAVLTLSGATSEISLALTLFSATLSITLYGLVVFHYLAWVFGMSEAAIRIRLLFEVGKKHNIGVKVEEILDRYNAETILDVRLQRLVSAGHVGFDGSRYKLKPSPLLIQLWLMNRIMKLLGVAKETSPAS